MIEIARQSIPSLALGAWVAVFGSVQPFLGAALTFTVLAQTLAALTSPQLTAYAELATAVVAVAGAYVQPSSGTLFWDSAPFPAALESIILGIAHQVRPACRWGQCASVDPPPATAITVPARPHQDTICRPLLPAGICTRPSATLGTRGKQRRTASAPKGLSSCASDPGPSA